LLAARVVPTIFYVRTRLRRLHSRAVSAAPTYCSHAAAVALASALAWAGLAPKLSIVAMIVLLLRAAFGITDGKPGTAKMIGLCEIGFGVLTVFAVAAGYLFGL
jgi:hypothetical protein